MKEYNKFTKELFAKGYTFEYYPEYARYPNSNCDRKLFDVLGGFEYQPWYRRQKVYETGCGLLCKGERFGSGWLSYGGIEWKPENNNPVIPCPYRKISCNLRHPLLNCSSSTEYMVYSQCDCHETERTYTYENSVDKICDDEKYLIRQQFEELKKVRNGHVCELQARYDYRTGQWNQHYDPIKCAEFCSQGGFFCSLKDTILSSKRGNVFYDVKITRVRRDGTLFDGQEEITIRKGCRLFESGKSMTICDEIAQTCSSAIYDKEYMNHHHENHIKGWNLEVQNIRAEQREHRDSWQDLQDSKSGIRVYHVSDQEKRAKEEKKLRRQLTKKKRKKALEKKVVQIGLENMKEYSAEYRHAMKWFSEEELENLEKRREVYLEEQKNAPHQLSLFETLLEERYE